MSPGTLPLEQAMPPVPLAATVKLDIAPVSISDQRRLDDLLRECWKRESSPAISTQAITTRDFVITLSRIEALRAEEEEDDRPSEHAYNMAVQLLREAAQELKMDFPRASASVGPGRGLRITWSSGTREIRLICGGSPTKKTYIYRESGSEHAVDYSVNGSWLAQYLRWVLHAF